MILPGFVSLLIIFVFRIEWSTAASSVTDITAETFLENTASSKENDIQPLAVVTNVRPFKSDANPNNSNSTGYSEGLEQEIVKTPAVPRSEDLNGVSNSSKRHSFTESQWMTKRLSYTISKYPRRTEILGGQKRINEEIGKAFGIWEEVADLFFDRLEGRTADIDIMFESGDHGDCEPFDNISGSWSWEGWLPSWSNVLGHAYTPGKIVHFDDDEMWTIDSYLGANLLAVAVHEVGHALGLNHSEETDSVMAPGSRGYVPNLRLHCDDIQAIQALYGKKTKSKPTNWKILIFAGTAAFCLVILVIIIYISI